MEKERWKVRMCVIVVALAAVIVGIIYYLQYMRPAELTEGVLISIIDDVGEGMDYYDVE